MEDETREAAAGPRADAVDRAEIEDWLIERIAARLRLPPAQVRVTTPFIEFGMGSVDAVEIAAELERWLGRRMSPTAIYNYPNIAALAQWLASPPPEPLPVVPAAAGQPRLSQRKTWSRSDCSKTSGT